MSDKSDAQTILRAYDAFERLWFQKAAAFRGYLDAMSRSENAEVMRHGARLNDLFNHPMYGVQNEFIAARQLYKLDDVRKRLAE